MSVTIKTLDNSVIKAEDGNKFEIFRACCTAIVRNRDVKALNYCVNYAQTGIHLAGARDEHECKVQCLYILNNMQYWRGELAKTVRRNLKRLAKDWN